MHFEHTLPSGRRLTVQVSPFADAKELLQAVLSEMKNIRIDSQTEIFGIAKDFICLGFSSPKIDALLFKCMQRCTVDGLKIDKDSFEHVDHRGDYIEVSIKVLEANLEPFMKSLYAKSLLLLQIVNSIQA